MWNFKENKIMKKENFFETRKKMSLTKGIVKCEDRVGVAGHLLSCLRQTKPAKYKLHKHK